MDLKDLRDIPVVGFVFAAGADILLYGADTIVSVIVIAGSTIEVWLPFLSSLSRLADVVDWIPTDGIQTILLLAFGLLVLYNGGRLVRRLTNN